MSSSTEDGNWVSEFCKLRGNEFFCEIDKEYIEDKFNLTGLSEKVKHYEKALAVILDVDDSPSDPDDHLSIAVEKLYGLIHARYILTNRGISQMMEKYQAGEFGYCPRVFCEKQPVLPIGLSDIPGKDQVKLYCPKCMDVYTPKQSKYQTLDGAYFGTGFPHMLFMVHPNQRPKKPTQQFVPKLYGFKIHPMAYQIQHEASKQEKHR